MAEPASSVRSVAMLITLSCSSNLAWLRSKLASASSLVICSRSDCDLVNSSVASCSSCIVSLSVLLVSTSCVPRVCTVESAYARSNKADSRATSSLVYSPSVDVKFFNSFCNDFCCEDNLLNSKKEAKSKGLEDKLSSWDCISPI